MVPRSSVPPALGPQDAALSLGTLRCLSRIRKALTHDLRSRLNGLTLTAELMAELGRQPGDGGTRAWASVERNARSMAGELRELGEELEHLLELFEVVPGEAASLDMGDALRVSTRWLTTFARMRGVGWTVQLPEPPVAVMAESAALRRALLLLGCESIERATAGAALELRVALGPPEAVLTLLGVDSALADAFADGVASASHDAEILVVRHALDLAGARVVSTAGPQRSLSITWRLASAGPQGESV